MSEAYVSYLLRPLSLAGGRPVAHWSELLRAAGYEVAEGLKFVKTPPEARARQLAEQLVTDQDRKEALLHHVSQARRHQREALVREVTRQGE
jgi:hypothetical protein